MNHKIAGVLLFPVGFFLLWLGGIALKDTIRAYNEYMNPASTMSGDYGFRMPLTTVEGLIVISALIFGASIAALVDGFLLLRRKPNTHVRTDSEITH